VNEADIGKIRPGQPVTFTVDAFPGEAFRGEVGKVRLNASMTQNVVTYTVEIVTDNSNGRLLPYLTANVQFELNRRSNVLLVPNAALRWKPAPDQVAPAALEAVADSGEGRGKPQESPPPAARGVLWRPAGKSVQPLAVRVGLSDGTLTEVAGDGLAEGLDVVIGLQAPSGAKKDTSNPFAPSFSRGGGAAGGGRPR
jgi:HlyD family secretion protein